MINKLSLAAPILFVALGLPVFASTTYDISFMETLEQFGGTAPSAGSFTYDGSTFTNFTVTWEGLTFDLTAAANAPFIDGEGCDSEASNPQFGFVLMSQAATNCASNSAYSWGGNDLPPSSGNQTAFFFTLQNGLSAQDTIQSGGQAGNTVDTQVQASGTWTITAETPEPASFGLVLLGTLAVGLRRYSRKSLDRPA